MKEGGAIRLSARRDDDAAGPRVCLVVEDCGAGIAPSEIHRIFEPFFSTKGEAGFGLGLATVKELVTLHGGTVEVRSELGKGTAFTIRLPAHSESHGRPRLATRWPASAHIGAGKQVLLVDDEPLVRRSTARLLARSGFSVTEAEDGLQACALVRKGQRIDVLLVDLDMPGMNGLATIRELRRELPRLPALMVSGHNTPAAQQQARAEGADFLAKPFSPRGLLEAVTAVLAAQPSACRPTEDSTVWQTIPDTGSYHWRGKPEG